MVDIVIPQIGDGPQKVPTQPSVVIDDLLKILETKYQLNQEFGDDVKGGLSEKGKRVYNTIITGGIDPSISEGLQGLTLGYSDEAMARIFSLTNKDALKEVSELLAGGIYNEADPQLTLYGGEPINLTPYEVSAGIQRLQLKQFQEQYPKGSLAINFAGSILNPLNRITPKNVGQAFTQGFGFGAAAGYGYEEGDAAQQGTGTALGAGFGGTLGAGLKVGGNFLGNVGGYIQHSFTPQSLTEKTAATKLVRDILQKEFGSVEEALVEFAKVGSGKPYTLADLGTNPRMLLDVSRMIPSMKKSEAENFLRNRQSGQLTRIQDDVTAAFGKKATIFNDVKALKAARGENAAKLYTSANKVKIPVNKSVMVKRQTNTGLIDAEVSLNDLFKRPSVEKALNQAKQIAKESGETLPNYVIKNGELYLGKAKVKEIPTEVLHIIKMGLDDVIFTNTSPLSAIGRTQRTAEGSTRKELLAIMDRYNPDYKKARNIYSGETQVLDAYNMGGQLLQKRDLFKNADELEELLKGMNASEKEAFRSGVVASIIEDLGGAIREGEQALTSRNLLNTLTNDPRKLRAVRLTFSDTPTGNAQFELFKKNLVIESDMVQTLRATQGSATAPRAEAMKRLFSDSYEINPNQGIFSLLTKIFGQNPEIAKSKSAERVAADVVNMLITNKTQGKQLENVINRLKVSDTEKALNFAMDLLRRSRSVAFESTYGISGSGGGQLGTAFQQRNIPNP